MEKKILIFILGLILFCSGCQKNEYHNFKGVIIAKNPNRYCANMIIEGEDKTRIHICSIYAHCPGEEDYQTAVIGDLVYIEYNHGNFSEQNIITKFEILEKK